MAKGGVAKQGADRGKAGGAGADAIPAVVFAVIEERTDQRGIEIAEVELRRLDVPARGGEAHQQPHRVSVAPFCACYRVVGVGELRDQCPNQAGWSRSSRQTRAAHQGPRVP